MNRVYAKIGSDQVLGEFDVPSSEAFNNVYTSLQCLYPGCTVHFVEDRKRKWLFIVGELDKSPQNKKHIKGKNKNQSDNN